MLNKREVNNLKEHIKKRYTDNNKDYETFDSTAIIDESLSFTENKTIIDEQLNKILPKSEKEILLKITKDDIEKQEAQQILDEFKLVEKQLEQNPSIDYIKNKIEREFIPFEKSEKNLLYIFGSQGTSKSTSLRHILFERGFKEGSDFIFVGYTPINKLFEKFRKYNDNNVKFVILDDAQGLFKNEIARGMFLQAVDDKTKRNIYYDGGTKPTSTIIDFKPKVIIISNEMINNENILSRARIVQILLCYEQRLKYSENILKNKGASDDEIREIINHIKNKGGKKRISFDFRILGELLEDLRTNPKWKDKTILDERMSILIDCLENTNGIENAIQIFCLKTGLSRATAYRIYKEVKGL